MIVEKRTHAARGRRGTGDDRAWPRRRRRGNLSDKGIKGSGACKGKANADGSNDLTCTGTYSTGKAAMDKAAKKDKM